jgi:DUF3089 family protein
MGNIMRTRAGIGVLRGTAALLTVLLLAAACSGDDDAGTEGDGDGQGGDAAASEEQEPAVDPYDGHTSETYDGTENWLCHPDLADDQCRDLSATEIAPDGTQTRADLEPAEDPPIDCFYVYPTVSNDEGINSDLEPDEDEIHTVAAQAAPFATTCRVFAPVYRQLTLGAIGGGGFADDEARSMAYGDVLDAWQTYISQYNEGRGVVLIGHSQGTGHLVNLIAEEIDDEPALRDRLVSAILMGGTVAVPDGELVGGSFDNVAGCESADDTGCVIGFSTYPADNPPGDDSFFARVGAGPTPGGSAEDRALCVDPVGLAGGNGLADSIILSEAPLIGGSAEITEGISTRYVILPDAFEAGCQRTGAFDWFGVGKASEDDARPVEALTVETIGHQWGLHLVDANVAMGDLLEVVATQAEAFAGPG